MNQLEQLESHQLREVLHLLNKAKKLHEGGHHEAHEVAESGRQMLEEIIKDSYRKCPVCEEHGKDGKMSRRLDADGTFETETCDSCGYTMKHPARLF
jgi:hypothetical protein